MTEATTWPNVATPFGDNAFELAIVKLAMYDANFAAYFEGVLRAHLRTPQENLRTDTPSVAASLETGRPNDARISGEQPPLPSVGQQDPDDGTVPLADRLRFHANIVLGGDSQYPATKDILLEAATAVENLGTDRP